MTDQPVSISVHDPDKHVLLFKRIEYDLFAIAPLDALDLENRKVPATIVQGYSFSSACLINVWRDMYVYEHFESEKNCPSVRAKLNYHIAGTSRRNVRYCDGHPGTSVTVLPMCGCGERCNVKSSKMYAILRVKSRSKYVISFDTVAARAYWSDERCICERLVEVLSRLFFDWIRRCDEYRFNEDVMYKWINSDAFRICNGQILKMVTKDEMVSAIMKAIDDNRNGTQ